MTKFKILCCKQKHLISSWIELLEKKMYLLDTIQGLKADYIKAYYSDRLLTSDSYTFFTVCGSDYVKSVYF